MAITRSPRALASVATALGGSVQHGTVRRRSRNAGGSRPIVTGRGRRRSGMSRLPSGSRIAEALLDDAEDSVPEHVDLWTNIRAELASRDLSLSGEASGYAVAGHARSASGGTQVRIPARKSMNVAVGLIALIALVAAGLALLINGTVGTRLSE